MKNSISMHPHAAYFIILLNFTAIFFIILGFNVVVVRIMDL